jgi:uncharacterized lipoprotein YmbA
MMIFISGCSQKAYYMLSKPHRIEGERVPLAVTIGVERVSVPQYLREGKVPIQKGNRIVYLDDALWAVDIEEDLTNALIFDLQKSLPKSRVFHYPWEREGKIDAIVEVKIKRYIAQDGDIYLDAVVRVNNRDKIVSIKEPVKTQNPSDVVAGMQRAFFRLEREVIGILDDIAVSKRR